MVQRPQEQYRAVPAAESGMLFAGAVGRETEGAEEDFRGAGARALGCVDNGKVGARDD